ncbi:MAG: tetraacyldisaccharide 4'-kinase, partial [Prevotella sp.]
MIVTTEKDSVRLEDVDGLDDEVKNNIFILPIKIKFMLGGEKKFNNKIISYVRKNSRNSIMAER